jgi:hypothetical protein
MEDVMARKVSNPDNVVDTGTDTLANLVRLTKTRPPSSQHPRRPRLGPTAFDNHMWATYKTGDFGNVKVAVRQVQDVRVRLARSQRWLTSEHMAELERVVAAAPYTFKTSIVITDLNNNKLAEGPVKGNLTSPALSELADDDQVLLWFRMHLPLDLGRRARPGSYEHLRKG